MRRRTLPPLELPKGAPEAARERAAEFALSLADVAAGFSVSKQTAFDWATNGRMAPSGFRTQLPCLRIPAQGGKQPPLRFRLVDVKGFGVDHQMMFDELRLPLDLQRQMKVGAYAPGAGYTVVEDEKISELDAATQLGMPRTTLAKQRRRGVLNPDLLAGGTRYSQLAVHRVLDGTLELHRG